MSSTSDAYFLLVAAGYRKVEVSFSDKNPKRVLPTRNILTRRGKEPESKVNSGF
jgi:hypothetical protein